MWVSTYRPEGRAGRGTDKREPTPMAWALASHPCTPGKLLFFWTGIKAKALTILHSQDKSKYFF